GVRLTPARPKKTSAQMASRASAKSVPSRTRWIAARKALSVRPECLSGWRLDHLHGPASSFGRASSAPMRPTTPFTGSLADFASARCGSLRRGALQSNASRLRLLRGHRSRSRVAPALDDARVGGARFGVFAELVECRPEVEDGVRVLD